MSLGEFLEKNPPTKRAVDMRHMDRDGIWHEKPRRRVYSVWNDEAGLDVPKIVWDTYDTLPVRVTQHGASYGEEWAKETYGEIA